MCHNSDMRGFALPLVLGIITILTIVIISISDSVIHKVGIVIELDSRVRAETMTYSAFNEVIFNLMTATFTATGMKIHQVEGQDMTSDNKNMVTSEWWNLYGDPIVMHNGATVILRDAAGMVSPLAGTKIFQQLLDQIVNDRDRIAGFIDLLEDWMDADDFTRLNGGEAWNYRQEGYKYGPRNSFLQALDELRLIKGLSPAVFEKMRSDLIYWPGGINYLTMSENLLYACLQDKDMVKLLVDLRRAGQLSSVVFAGITGILETEENLTMPTGMIHAEITTQLHHATDRIEFVVLNTGTSTQPFTILEWRR